MFTRGYRSFSIVFSHSKQWCSMISPCFSLVSHEFLHDFPMGFSHSKRRPARKMGRHQGILQEALSRQDGRSGAVGCGMWHLCCRSDKITQNIPKWWDNMGHLHTFTWFERETYDVLYYFMLDLYDAKWVNTYIYICICIVIYQTGSLGLNTYF